MKLFLPLLLLISFTHGAELKTNWTTEFVGSLDGKKEIRLLLYRDKKDIIIGSFFNPKKLS
jgi:hypothetical protein